MTTIITITQSARGFITSCFVKVTLLPTSQKIPTATDPFVAAGDDNRVLWLLLAQPFKDQMDSVKLSVERLRGVKADAVTEQRRQRPEAFFILLHGKEERCRNLDQCRLKKGAMDLSEIPLRGGILILPLRCLMCQTSF